MFNNVVKLKDSGPFHTGGKDLGFSFQLEIWFYATLSKHVFETAAPRACSISNWPKD